MSRARGPLLTVGAVLVGAATLTVLGLDVRDAAVLAVAVSVQGLAGAYLWLVVTGRDASPRDPVEVVGGGLGMGTALAAICGVVLRPLSPWGWALPAAVAAAVWIVRRVRGSDPVVRGWAARRSTLVGAVVGLTVGLGAIALNLARYPLGTDGPWLTYHRDMLYFEGLSTSVGVFGGDDSIFMAGADVRYHWLAYAWVGQLTHATSAAPFAVLTRVLPIVALVGCLGLVVTWAARLLDRTAVTTLAAVLLAGGGYLGAANGTILNFDSPSQNLTTVWLLVALVAALACLTSRFALGLLATVALMMAATVGGKVSSGAVALLPVLLVAVVGSLRREPWARRAWLVSVVSIVAAAAVYVLMIRGSASGGDLHVLSLDSRASSIQGLDSSAGPRGVMLGTLGLILAMAARWWGLAWLVGERSWRWRPDVIVGVGLVLVAVVPVVVLSQGVNETWFALAASAPLAVLSAVGVGTAWVRVRNRGALWASVAAGLVATLIVPAFWIPNPAYTTSVRFWGPWVGYGVAVVTAVVIAAAARRSGFVRVLGASTITILVVAGATARVAPAAAARYHPAAVETPTAQASVDASGVASKETPDGNIAPVIEPPADLLAGSSPDRTTWTRAEAEAAQYLRDNAELDAVVVTNETTSFLVPALGQRLTYVSGAPYQALYGGAGTVGGIPERIDASLRFTRDRDPTAFATLCSAGVSWGWVARDASTRSSWEPYAEVVYANDAVDIIRIRQEACAAAGTP